MADMTAKHLTVHLSDTRHYPITIGPGLLHNADLFVPYIAGARCIVTNETIAPLYLDTLKNN